MNKYLKSEEDIRALLYKKMVDDELTTAHIAREVGLAYGTIQRFLDGIGVPYFTTLVRISKYLDVIEEATK